MSDCFDHMVDAFESFDRSMDEGFGSSREENYDPLFYHAKLEFLEIKRETEKAYCMLLKNKEVLWIPKSICKSLNLNKKTVFVHRKTFNTIRAKK